MNILFRREQFQNTFGKIRFRLWGKIEPDEEESRLIDVYDFRNAELMGEMQKGLRKQCALIGGLVAVLVGVVFKLGWEWESPTSIFIALLAGAGAAYWWFTEKRELIIVRDLLHGRTFRCNSVIELAQKEAKLEYAAYLLRQVLESSKTWDGTETNPIEPLPKDEAKQLILRAFPDVT